MKLVKITTAYNTYLKSFYARHREIVDKSYTDQKRLLDFDGFGWSDFWKCALEPMGYTVTEFLANAEPLQKVWARENGVDYNEDRWALEILEYQIIREEPVVLFVVDYSTFTYKWITELRAKCPSIKLVMGWCGAPFRDASVFRAYDVVLSCIPELVEQFRQMGHKSEHVNHAFDPRIISRLDLVQLPDIDFSFVGQIVRDNQFHLEREYILEKLVSQINVSIFSPSADVGVADELKALLKIILFSSVKVIKGFGIPESTLARVPVIGKAAKWKIRPMRPVSPKLKPYMQPGVFGLQMFQTLRNSKLTFNNHIDISPRSASNIRLFEATGVGACLVTDWKENISELFETDKEVVTYKSADECIEKVNWLLGHPDKREAMAKAGQDRTLKDHTFACRAVQMDKIIKYAIK